jgi:hypothetical protein
MNSRNSNKTPSWGINVKSPISIKAPAAMSGHPTYTSEMDDTHKLSMAYEDGTNISISVSIKGDIIIDWGDQEFYFNTKNFCRFGPNS